MIGSGVFIGALVSNSVLLVITVLVIGTVFVNGATDASNAIATAIGARSINPDAAIAMGAICNFIGLIVMTYLSTAVADTISKMVNFGGDGAFCADGARLGDGRQSACVPSSGTWRGAWFSRGSARSRSAASSDGHLRCCSCASSSAS